MVRQGTPEGHRRTKYLDTGQVASPAPGGVVPPEIADVLRQPFSQSLLVRGCCGSGRTTLALSLLEAFPGRRVLVTGRVEKDRLLHYHSWLKRESEVEVVEIDAGLDELRSVRRAVLVLRLQSHPGDARTELPVSDRWAWLPPKLQELWRSILPNDPTLVAVDSWDGLLDAYMEAPPEPNEHLPSREEIERILLRSMTLGNAHRIPVVERGNHTQLDYLVDGVVSLSATVAEDRQERWLGIVKLRGVRVDDNSYPFTLDGGRFLALHTLPADIRGAAARAEPDPAPASGFIWPGSRAFAEAFGRLPMGQLSLLEVDGGVRADGLRLSFTPLVDSVLSRGGRVLVCVSPTRAPEAFWEVLKDDVTLRQYTEQFRSLVAVRPPAVPEDLEATTLTIPDAISPPEQSFFKRTVEFVQKPPRDPTAGNFGLLWQTGLRLLVEGSGMRYGVETASRVVQSYLNHSPVHVMIFTCLLLGQSGDAVFDSLSEMSATHIRVRDRKGRVFVNGIRPRTPSYALGESDDDDDPPYRLQRVV